MKAEFWHDKWRSKQIGFHNEQVHPLLAAHLPGLKLTAGSRVFLPLCGKTRDIAWLLNCGYRVVGSELSEIAVAELFSELGLSPSVQKADTLVHYQAEGLDVFAGDIFALTPEQIGTVDGTYDRAALVALPADMRERYAAHVTDITGAAPQLLISFDYDQTAMAGPPFSVEQSVVRGYYDAHYAVERVASVPVAGGLKGKCAADEQVYYLKPLHAEG